MKYKSIIYISIILLYQLVDKLIMAKYTDITNSAIATIVAEIITLPICTFKTNYQNNSTLSMQQCLKNIYMKNGISGFYKASVPAIMSQTYSTSSKYFLFRFFENKNYPYTNKMINGIISGILTSLITHPIDNIKIHLQMNDSFMCKLRENGFGLFYRGYSKSFGKTVISSSMFFPLYETLNEYFEKPVVSSMLTAIISTTIMQPLDFLKTRHIYGLSLYNGLNLQHYYRGLSLNLMRIVPHFVITMTTIDFLNKKTLQY